MSDSKLRFWLRAVWLVAYVLMVVSMLNNLFRLNTDAIAYMRVAEYWSVGNFDLAVNGYWGPLLSLLMVPFLWIGVDPLISGKLVMLISAAVFFHGSQFLVRSVGLGLLDELIMALVLALTLPSWMTEGAGPSTAPPQNFAAVAAAAAAEAAAAAARWKKQLYACGTTCKKT